MIYIDVFVETEETKALNDSGVECSFEMLDIGKALINDFTCITPVFDHYSREYSKIEIYEDLYFYSPMKVSEIYNLIQKENTIWQRKN